MSILQCSDDHVGTKNAVRFAAWPTEVAYRGEQHESPSTESL